MALAVPRIGAALLSPSPWLSPFARHRVSAARSCAPRLSVARLPFVPRTCSTVQPAWLVRFEAATPLSRRAARASELPQSVGWELPRWVEGTLFWGAPCSPEPAVPVRAARARRAGAAPGVLSYPECPQASGARWGSPHTETAP